MALIVIPSRGARYVRAAGLSFDSSPEPLKFSGQILAWVVPPTRPVSFFVFGYKDAEARQMEAAPLWMDQASVTVGDLDVLSEGEFKQMEVRRDLTPDALYAAIYGVLRQQFEVVEDDLEKREPAPTAFYKRRIVGQ